jgi:hypothetical protein
MTVATGTRDPNREIRRPPLATENDLTASQSPVRWTSTATAANTAASPGMNRAATSGGSRPEAVHERRRSTKAAALGRDPVCFGGDSGRLAMNATSSSSSPSLSGCAGLGGSAWQVDRAYDNGWTDRASDRHPRTGVQTVMACARSMGVGQASYGGGMGCCRTRRNGVGRAMRRWSPF